MKKKPKSQNPDRDHPFIELTEGAMSFFRKYYAPILNSECSQAASVFDVLVTFVNRENGPDNGLAFPSRKRIQGQLGGEGRISELQITRCTKCLESHSFLLERRKGAPGKSMRYRGQIPSREKFLSTYGISLTDVKKASNVKAVYDENMQDFIEFIPEHIRQKTLSWFFDLDLYERYVAEHKLAYGLDNKLANGQDNKVPYDENIKGENIKGEKKIDYSACGTTTYINCVSPSYTTPKGKVNRPASESTSPPPKPHSVSCVFGGGLEDDEVEVSRNEMVQQFARKFQQAVVAYGKKFPNAGFADESYFANHKGWWKNNRPEIDKRLDQEDSIDFWIDRYHRLVEHWQNSEPKDIEYRDNSFDLVPKIRNVKALLIFEMKLLFHKTESDLRQAHH